MKDEIKEILEFKENADYKRLSIDEIIVIKDYITYLQEENEMYKKELEKADSITQSCIFEGSRSARKSYRQCLNWLENYKSRCEKAIKCIKDKYYKEEYERKGTFANKLMNILQGSDKDE